MLMIKEGTEVHYFGIYSTGIVTQLDWNKKCTRRMSPLVAAAGWQWNKEMQIKLNEKFAIMEIAFIYYFDGTLHASFVPPFFSARPLSLIGHTLIHKNCSTRTRMHSDDFTPPAISQHSADGDG